MLLNTLIETNKIVSREKLSNEVQNDVPEGAIFFEGIVSTGDKNRNGYIIESDAWFFERNKYVKLFLNSGSVLWGHNDEKPIGRPLSFEKMENGQIKVTGFVFDDVHTNGAIGRGIVLGLSTGHISHEVVWQNADDVRITDDEFWALPWSEIFSDKWTMVVTKAEIVEFSFVSTPSNRKSVINANNVKANAYAERVKKPLTEVEHLFLNPNIRMNAIKKDNVDGEPEVTPTPEVATPEATPTPSADTPQPEKEENKVETSDVPTLENKIKELETNHAAEIDKLKATHAAELNAVRQEEREKLAQVNGGNAAGSVKTMADFKNKHISK